MGLRAALDATFQTLPAQLTTPGSGGVVCRAISDLYDAAIASGSPPRARASRRRWRSSRPAAGRAASSRRSPTSTSSSCTTRTRRAAKQVADRLLYPLWDEKLAIGHAIREARATARLARDDLATATALLDARHIAGDRALTTELVRATLGVLAPGGNPNDFIAMLAAEQKGRHERFGASLYLLEPNLKQGIGALRDLATALWAAQVRWHPPRPGDRSGDDRGADRGPRRARPPDARQGDVLANARDFMLRVRTLVQLTTKRRFDQLTFEIQEALGPKLFPGAKAHEGDIRSAVAPAVEALMREYYLHAREVVQVTDRLLESARVPARRKPRIAQVDASFITFNGELAIKDPRLFTERPSEMVRLFRVAVDQQVPVYGHTRELIAEAIAREPHALANDPLAGRLWLEALRRSAGQPRSRARSRSMHQLGIVSAIVPEWAPCTARVQHDLYHVYTVDQHQLYAVAMQKRIARGELAAEHPLATELWREIKRPASLLLGTLLHDVGKPLGKGHAEKGAVVTRAVGERLGMPEPEVELAEFLVRQHLTMSHLSQRRDLSDPEEIARFAEKVGDEEHLVQLYLVTLCDTAMTATDNLNAWKDGLLRDLLLRTREHFRGNAGGAAATPSGSARKAVQIAVEGEELEPDGARAARRRHRSAAVRAAVAAPGRPPGPARARRARKTPPIALEVHCYPMKGPARRDRRAGCARRARGNRRGADGGARRRARCRARSRRSSSAKRLVLRYVLRARPQGQGDPRGRRALDPLLADLRELLAAPPNPAAVASANREAAAEERRCPSA